MTAERRTRLQPAVVQIGTDVADVMGKVMSVAEAFAKEMVPALGVGWFAGVNKLMV